MTVESQQKTYLDGPAGEGAAMAPLTPVVQLEHLLKVAGSISRDANKTWAEVWGELKHLSTGGGMIVPETAEGFVPKCGWPEFMENLWLLKHYLDSIQRICDKKH